MFNQIITNKTFTTKTPGKVFKSQHGPLKCNSEKVLYLLRFKVCNDTPYVGKTPMNCHLQFSNYKNKHHVMQENVT